jgi:hypothetical protein
MLDAERSGVVRASQSGHGDLQPQAPLPINDIEAAVCEACLHAIVCDAQTSEIAEHVGNNLDERRNRRRLRRLVKQIHP